MDMRANPAVHAAHEPDDVAVSRPIGACGKRRPMRETPKYDRAESKGR